MKINIKDIDDRDIEFGHIVAVRYVWNSYVGEVKLNGLCATGAKRHAFFSPHQIEQKFHYQILSHINPNHPDFNQEVNDWYLSEVDGFVCPIKIRIYDNFNEEK